MISRNLNGWKPQKKDFRDKIYKHDETVKLPVSTDLRKGMPPIQDQGDLGSCVSCATVSAVEYTEILHKDKAYEGLSELFVYWNGRVIEGTTNEDSGLEIRDAIKAIMKQGVCSETSWPYRDNLLYRKPQQACYTEGIRHKLTAYMAIQNVQGIKTALAAGYPVIVGITCYDSFLSDETAKTGIIPMPTEEESVQGGHAILLCGYDDSKKWSIFKNSWGTSWGASGYGFIPYDYITQLGSDFWTIVTEQGF